MHNASLLCVSTINEKQHQQAALQQSVMQTPLLDASPLIYWAWKGYA